MPKRLNQLLVAGAASLGLCTAAIAQPADNTLVVGLSADITTMEPSAISSRDNSNIARHVFGKIAHYLVEQVTVADRLHQAALHQR